jgi:hypothetical protein
VNFELASVRNRPADTPEGWDLSTKGPEPFPKSKAATGGAAERFEATVIVSRHGALELPVSILVTFADGTSKVETWDGTGSHREYRYEGPKVVAVEVDPEGYRQGSMNEGLSKWHFGHLMVMSDPFENLWLKIIKECVRQEKII